MPRDVDYLFAMKDIEVIAEIVSSLPHMGRSDIADDISEFTEKMKEKYGNKNNK